MMSARSLRRSFVDGYTTYHAEDRETQGYADERKLHATRVLGVVFLFLFLFGRLLGGLDALVLVWCDISAIVGHGSRLRGYRCGYGLHLLVCE